MPYIKQEDYARSVEHPQTSGELNYAITVRLINAYKLQADPMVLNVMRTGIRKVITFYWENAKEQNYSAINDIFGAIAGAILEFRRRSGPVTFGASGLARVQIARHVSKVVDEFYMQVAAPFEDQKIIENGDIYS